MKFVLVIVALYVLYWLLRRSLRGIVPPRQAPPPAVPEPRPMLACAHCGLHLPRDEALPGHGVVFCGEAHRRAYEQAHPGS
jgi:uncharacterized protein